MMLSILVVEPFTEKLRDFLSPLHRLSLVQIVWLSKLRLSMGD